MKYSERERLLVEKLRQAIDAVVLKNIRIIEDNCGEGALDNYFCKQIKKISFENKSIIVEFVGLASLKFIGVEVEVGEELIKKQIIKQINFIKVIKRGGKLYVSALVEVRKRRSFDFLEFYTEKICC